MRIHCTIAVILFSAAFANAQNPATPGSGGAETILRSETRVVLVDAAVIDRKNRFVRDLTQKDFHTSREDGKEQKISSFSLESSGVSPERSTKHYIVLYFDTATLNSATLLSVRQDALRFVDAFASPDRNIAVITFGDTTQILQNFTADPARVKGALNKVQNFNGGKLPRGWRACARWPWQRRRASSRRFRVPAHAGVSPHRGGFGFDNPRTQSSRAVQRRCQYGCRYQQ